MASIPLHVRQEHAIRRIGDYEGERWRAFEMLTGEKYRPVRTALTEGCYDEIFEASRSIDRRDDWFFRRFVAEYPNADEAADYLQSLWVRTATVRSEWQFIPRDDMRGEAVDWLAVGTAPQDKTQLLLTKVRDLGCQVSAEVISGCVAAMLLVARNAIVQASGCSPGWEQQRLSLDLLRTSRLAGAEIALNVPERERDNVAAVAQWLEGKVGLWTTGRKSLPFT